jgi:CheY-like chemotaxis protein
MQEKPKSVLVIDDQADERSIQRAMLGHLGYEVREAEDGNQGLQTALEAPPDLILLDVAMPHMDGFMVCQELRANPRTRGIPVLLFTASAVTDFRERAEAVGATGFIIKPVDPHRVAQEVHRLIGPPRT